MDQNFANHRRFHPPFHFFVIPIMVINVVVAVTLLVRTPSLWSSWQLLFAIGLLTLSILPRSYALKVQDRVIRLEERLRIQQLSQAPKTEIDRLTPRQLVTLRFCSDEQLAELTQEVLSGTVKNTKEIKQRIKLWRADYLRV